MADVETNQCVKESGAVICVYCLFFITLGIWAMVPLIALAEDGSRMLPSGLSNTLGAFFALFCFIAAIGTYLRNKVLGFRLGQIIIVAGLCYLGFKIVTSNIEGEKHFLLYFTTAILLLVLSVFHTKVEKYFSVPGSAKNSAKENGTISGKPN